MYGEEKTYKTVFVWVFKWMHLCIILLSKSSSGLPASSNYYTTSVSHRGGKSPLLHVELCLTLVDNMSNTGGVHVTWYTLFPRRKKYCFISAFVILCFIVINEANYNSFSYFNFLFFKCKNESCDRICVTSHYIGIWMYLCIYIIYFCLVSSYTHAL